MWVSIRRAKRESSISGIDGNQGGIVNTEALGHRVGEMPTHAFDNLLFIVLMFPLRNVEGLRASH